MTLCSGYAPNAYLFMDHEEPSMIASANIGRQSGVATRADGSKVFFNTPFKWTAGKARLFKYFTSD